MKKSPSEMFLSKLVHDFGEDVPDKIGFHLFGIPTVVFTTADHLDELYVTKNAFYTKHPLKRDGSRPLLVDSLATMDTDDPAYKKKRKAISAAFLKSKMSEIVDITKQSAFHSFAELQQNGKEFNVDLVSTTS
mmetsp:Transcript_4253/g.5673  ORF Transcript_4253/g.5673 Transcript_4253/m.5673 type:complete len:133 (+) Transcript_4253:166-564(+)|eukprot:CAMPEP_0185575382 /NCGR_PEP_ID=MMETSP0434-20130131/6601_1 /TAXON_ID=626734 ORGANISM="Favella taraikaensis, Strain Fe Narragansett Bay" /NCGR_SAMPLE_ID=MMETSP0434 /ASSEMBLY_ACC=CAM_ASM_000379 /LENGTH=132 /DNA_ID=CAMNT_0028192255 /DNA_START=97 /DNA_END=495 /DNA_ORIENTATION=+